MYNIMKGVLEGRTHLYQNLLVSRPTDWCNFDSITNL